MPKMEAKPPMNYLRSYFKKHGSLPPQYKHLEGEFKTPPPLTAEQKQILEEAISSRPAAAIGNSGGGDYMAMVAKYREAKKCSTFDAMMAVNATAEGKAARIRYIKRINPHIENYGE